MNTVVSLDLDSRERFTLCILDDVSFSPEPVPPAQEIPLESQEANGAKFDAPTKVKAGASPEVIRVLLADDHLLVRTGIRVMLESLGGIEVVAQASEGTDALEIIAQSNPKPDIAILDISMGGMAGMGGLEAAARIARDHSEVRVIILTMHSSVEYVLKARNAGALGFLLKDSDFDELEAGVRAVARGEHYLSSAIPPEAVEKYLLRNGAGEDPNVLLTPRQQEILRLLAQGMNTKEIAHNLKIAAKTVDTHRSQLMARLNIFDVPSLVRFAIRVGLVDLR